MTQYHSPTGDLDHALVIGFCNSKGGPGKSTLALNSTVELFDQGRSVAYIDAEQFAPNAKALNKYDDRISTRAETTMFGIDDAIEELSTSHEVILLDAPGHPTGQEITTICALSDLLIVPMKTSRKDIRQTKPTLQMVERSIRKQHGKPEMVIVFNEVHENSVAARKYREQLTGRGYHVANAEIRLYGYHRDCEFVTREPDKDRVKNSHKCAQDIFNFVYEVIQPRLRPVKVAANE